MDPRIDLTENRDFRKVNPTNNSSGVWHFKSTNHSIFNIPHLPEPSTTNDYHLIDNGYITQGSKYDRKSKKFDQDFCNFITCDCCGKHIYPYLNDTLCEHCKSSIEYKLPDWYRN